MRIVQMSGIHVGPGFKPELLESTIEETNEYEANLVAVAGDLTMSGHLSEFEEAKSYLDRLECESVVVPMGKTPRTSATGISRTSSAGARARGRCRPRKARPGS